ncbi:tRNA dimethylallyltransferase [Cladophialophora bantiana CBS 173.52]|uniref:tRNA dimethylallyltransferase n=1 Tax=Cladophialophora bantiana (strain ATCC 10958 / CBS 173.52 / CDC B-1940 / NIH 8579) TaxID=1442370 RepID=A0A0D2IKR3_CLAB1|nr:tRNA dimethylallyltransferase [Cladophialophora bantiana CBS 173.52]KIW97394.1 tRNA dimethylallyltransferase [Cladophialophora bantiana CBS 173.52]
MASSPQRNPLVMIIGATGTGKSKLAVELATRFNGEVINCDAMQMYKGLPIITNKIPEDERNGIPHHLLDFIGLKDKLWTVQHFVKESSRVIDEIRARGRLPIVVGGTIYYTFSLLFNDAILTPDGDENRSDHDAIDRNEEFPILSASTEEIFAKLKEVDPEMAKKWHPNDRNKIRRSLQIYLQSGRTASDIYAEQRQAHLVHGNGDTTIDTDMDEDGAMSGRRMTLRYPSLLLWLEADDVVLKQRLNDRVDAMIANGLCDEVLQMASLEQELKQEAEPVDLANGIWGSIGYKEMKPWLEVRQALNPDPAKVAVAEQQGIDAVKASTRRYAKRQNRFVRIRLAKALKAAGRFDLLFLLDCTDSTSWDSTVTEPTQAIVNPFLKGHKLPEAKSLSLMAEKVLSQIEQDDMNDVREARTCQLCQKTLMTEKEWRAHLASRSHKKLVVRHRNRVSVPAAAIDVIQHVQLPTSPG